MSYLFAVTTTLGCAGVILPALLQFILRLFGRESPSERQMRQEANKLKQQLQGISMVDQFATYARIQRKINTINQQYRDKVSERLIGEQRVRLAVGGLIRVVVGMLCVWLVWEYRSHPVLSLPPDLVWPLGSLLAFPSCQLGQISVMVWLGVVRTVCSRLSVYFTVATPKPPPQPPTPSFNLTATPVSFPLD